MKNIWYEQYNYINEHIQNILKSGGFKDYCEACHNLVQADPWRIIHVSELVLIHLLYQAELSDRLRSLHNLCMTSA